MAQRVRIQCIHKADRKDPHKYITHIGGVNDDGTRWEMPEDKAIAGIESDKWSFYVHEGKTVDVVIETSSTGHKFLRTKTDYYKPDNLLSLPECP